MKAEVATYRKQLPEIIYKKFNFICYVDSDYFILRQDEDDNEVAYLYDIEGNLLQAYPLILEDSTRMYAAIFTRLEGGGFLSASVTDASIAMDVETDILFTKYDLDGTISLKKHLRMRPIDYWFSPRFLQ